MERLKDLKIRAAQLRKPTGVEGEYIAEKMNEGNEMMCRLTYDKLDVKPGNDILEIGMGNGHFVPHLMSKEKNTTYLGIDYSPLMVETAQGKNTELIKKGRVRFLTMSLDEVSTLNQRFDRICTTNTLYFWPEPQKNMVDLVGLLKPGGKLLIAIRPKDIFEKIPVTQFGFSKFENSEVSELMNQAGLRAIHFDVVEEPDRTVEDERYELKSAYFIGRK